MIRRLISGLVVVALALAIGGSALAQETDDTLSAALEYLRTVQGEDGGFSNGFAPESDLGATADAVVAIAAAGEDVAEYAAGDDQTPLDALGALIEAGVADENAGQLAKVITALVAAGEDPSDFNGRDLVSDLLALQGEEGTFGMGAFDHCLSVIALQNAGEPLPDGALDALLAAQNDDGGWGFIADQASDTTRRDCACRRWPVKTPRTPLAAGWTIWRASRTRTAAGPIKVERLGTTSDASSTALVVQALIALEEDLTEWNNPQDF